MGGLIVLLFIGCIAGIVIAAVNPTARDTMTRIFRPLGGAGSVDAKTGEARTTPWKAATNDGMIVGHNDEVWLYWIVPTAPFMAEDPSEQLNIGAPLHDMLNELGDTSRPPILNIKSTADAREIHIVALQWEEVPKPPATATRAQADYLTRTFQFLAGCKTVFIGVRLRPGGLASSMGTDGFAKHLLRMTRRAMSAQGPQLSDFRRDRELVQAILARAGGRRPNTEEFRRLTAWYADGAFADTLLIAEDDGQRITTAAFPEGLQMAAVIEFENIVSQSPGSKWAADAFAHTNAPVVMSIRADLMTSDQARLMFRRVQRQAISQIEEQAASMDPLSRKEDADRLQTGAQVENYYLDSGEPCLADTSIVIGVRVTDDDNALDMLRSRYGIIAKPVEKRQIETLSETLPCASQRLGRSKAFGQYLSIAQLAYAGLSSFSHLGDKDGMYLGLSLPDHAPIYVDPDAAGNENAAPAMAIVGEPGSGKTQAGLLLAYQASQLGKAVIFINPKSASPLREFAEFAGWETVSLRDLESEGGGALDPFRYATEPAIAAEMLTSHILAQLPDLPDRQVVELRAGIQEGALAGAQCAVEALSYVADREVVDLVRRMAEGSSLFALAISERPRGRIGFGGRGRGTLIEFDRPLMLPPTVGRMRDFEPDQRLAVATMRLVTRASLEILLTANGGVLCVDEAWTFLGSAEGIAALTQLGREGRSQGILPIMMTQKIDDVIRQGVDMESFISRVLVLQTRDPKEASAGLRLVGLEPTEERKRWLSRAGAVRPSEDHPGRGALGFYSDIHGRHSGLMVGPILPELLYWSSTNRLDIQQRRVDAETAV